MATTVSHATFIKLPQLPVEVAACSRCHSFPVVKRQSNDLWAVICHHYHPPILVANYSVLQEALLAWNKLSQAKESVN